MAESAIQKLVINEREVKNLEQQTADTMMFDDIDQAKQFVRQTWPQVIADNKLPKERPELYQRLEKLHQVNSIILIPALSEKQLLGLLEKGINWYFQEMMTNHDIWEKIRGYLVAEFPEDRDAIKEKIRRALLENEELITRDKIERNEKDYLPSIKEWLIDYTSVVGVGKADNLRVNEYFTSNKNFQKLPAGEKIKVRNLIVLYERLKRSSLEPEGLEERVSFSVDGQDYLYDEGRIELLSRERVEPRLAPEGPTITEPTPAPVTPSIEQAVLTAYQGDVKQQQAIARVQEKLEKKFRDDMARIREEFFSAVQKKNINKTVATLRILAENQDLENFLREDTKLNKFLTTIWAKQYGQDLVEEFNQKPDQLKFVRLFLQYVLQDRLGMSSNDAARVGLQIGNIFVGLGKKGYNKMAYFEVKEKSFKWFE
jgi:hypothetical protein